MAEDKKPFNCFEHHDSKRQPAFKKLSEFLAENYPELKVQEVEKAVTAFGKYMSYLRGDKNQISQFCDICFCPITEEEASRTTIYDYNYCCTKHDQYRDKYNHSLARHEQGIKEEDLIRPNLFQ